MRAVKFYKHRDQWRYKEIGKEVSDTVDTRALENILGVMGGPLIYVCRETGKTPAKLRIEIRNGFITRASLAPDDDVPLTLGEEVDTFCIRPMAN
jgi:hypothetical protein